VLVAAQAVAGAPATLAYGRLALGLAGTLYVLATVGPRAAAVGPKRLAALEALRPALAEARVVAALDVGWVGAATEANIVDLAGVTDPAVAILPGGHTTKDVPQALLVTRGVDTLVLLLAPGESLAEPWTASGFARYVELSVAAMPRMALDFAPVAQSQPPLSYVVLRRVVGD
jgi:hypothetical protein